MQNHNRLFSYKQIVGISLFLSVVLVFSFTGFQFSTPISLPNLPQIPNLFENYCDTNYPLKKPYCQIAHELTYNDMKDDSTKYQEYYNDRMNVIDNMSCADLPLLYQTNSGWDPLLRNHIAYRITYECP